MITHPGVFGIEWRSRNCIAAVGGVAVIAKGVVEGQGRPLQGGVSKRRRLAEGQATEGVPNLYDIANDQSSAHKQSA